MSLRSRRRNWGINSAAGCSAIFSANLNGLPHEIKYIDEPGNVEHYTPVLPEGAWTDDDTDIEWVYLLAIRRIARVTVCRRNDRAALEDAHQPAHLVRQQYARDLMDLGIEPPLTGTSR